MTKYNIYKLQYSTTVGKSVYIVAKEIEINDNLIESQEKVAEDSELDYYRISMTSGKTYIIGKNKQ